MTKLSNVLKQLMCEQGLNTSELARLTGILQPVMHRLLSGETDNPKIATLFPIAQYFNITIDQLIGEAPLPKNRIAGSHQKSEHGWKKIPLLSWHDLINWPQISKKDENNYSIETTATVGEGSYALKVKDSTMLPRFPEGTLLIVDPNLKPEDRDFVIIQLEPNIEPSFKQVLFDSNEIYLKPLNPDFKINHIDKTKQFQFLGIVVETKMSCRD